jgi:PAS domain S-box-containing protein
MKFPRSLFPRRLFRPAPVKSYLVGVILGGLGPLLIFSVVMMILFTRQEQANRRRGLQDTARALSLAIDQEINASITHLESLATSEPLDAGAVSEFRRVAARILRIQDSWQSIMLFDPDGRRALSVGEPLNPGAATMSRESLQQLLRSRRPVISDFPGGAGAAQQIHVYVPVIREGKIIYVLAAAIEPQVFTEILLRQKIPSRWVATLFDSRQIVLARSRDAARHVGYSVEPLLGKIDARRSEAFLSVQRQNEMAVYAAVNRSAISGWSLALIVPRSEINAILRRSLGAVVIGGLSLLGLGVAVALLFARQVSRSVARLSSVAHELGGGRLTAAAVDTPIAELNELAKAMKRAAVLLHERENQRDQVEAALREQEEFLKRQADLLNLANEAIFAWDREGRIIFWNRGAEQLYGFSQAEAVGRLNYDLLSTEPARAAEPFEVALEVHGEWSGELQQKAKNGRRIVVESRIKRIADRAGRPIALECARDITSRKRAAQRLAMEQAVTRTLAESLTLDEASSKILQAIGEGMGWDIGIFWEVNKPAERLRFLAAWQGGGNGLTPFVEDNRHRTFARGVALPGRAWTREESIWIADLARDGQEARQQDAARRGLLSAFAFPIMLPREVFGVLEFFGRAVREEDRDFVRLSQAIGSEIGQFVERIRAEEALRASETRLRNQAHELEEQLLASGRLVAVGELTASMAHEFNNPLGIILGFAQGLLASLDRSDPNRRHVQIIAEEAKRCERLVQELLEFGRPSKGEFAPIDIAGVIARTMELVQNRASASNVETVTEAAHDLPRIHADAQQLQQVLLNLCLNAIDAMPKGGKLTVRAVQDGERTICLTVADTGYGIDPDTLRKIFQPFFTARKKRGLGLGLSISDRIVKSHRGTLSASSTPGAGTTFTVRLPILAEPAPIEPQKRPTAPV